jgi:hypothetical protein
LFQWWTVGDMISDVVGAVSATRVNASQMVHREAML